VQKSSMNFVKGMGAGMVAGAMVTFVAKSMIGNKNKVGKGSAKVVRAAGDLFDGIQTMFK